MKLVIGILSVIVCSYIGFNACKKYKNRFEFYNGFLIYNKKLKNMIAFSNTSLKSALKAEQSADIFTCSLKDFLLEGKPFNSLSFNSEELTFINGYFETLGKSDRLSQIKFLDGIDSTLNKYYLDSQTEYKKYKSIYLKVGFLFGLIILIILL